VVRPPPRRDPGAGSGWALAPDPDSRRGDLMASVYESSAASPWPIAPASVRAMPTRPYVHRLLVGSGCGAEFRRFTRSRHVAASSGAGSTGTRQRDWHTSVIGYRARHT
jgi:hypothetical protein